MTGDDIRIEAVYGFIRLDSGWRAMPDGSLMGTCRIRKYDNKPNDPEHLVSDVTNDTGCRLFWD